MPKLNDFQNDGFGWYCRHCAREYSKSGRAGEHSRLILEGESESKTPDLSTPALAKWADAARTTLVCPNCGITELVEVQ